MVKLTGPGLARGASGTLADQLIFSTWKGKAYLKRHRNPAQPRTPAQIAMRAVMRFLSQEWTNLSDALKDSWAALAAATNISPFNAYQAFNLARYRTFGSPSGIYPPIGAGGDPNLGGVSITDHVVGFTCHWNIIAQAETFGMALHLVPASGGTITWDNLLHITPIPTAGWYQQYLGPFDPGCYWIAFNPIKWTGDRRATSAYRCGTATG